MSISSQVFGAILKLSASALLLTFAVCTIKVSQTLISTLLSGKNFINDTNSSLNINIENNSNSGSNLSNILKGFASLLNIFVEDRAASINLHISRQ